MTLVERLAAIVHALPDGGAVTLPVAELRRWLEEETDHARSVQDETLSLGEAALESGYSVDHLRHLVASGELSNVGRKGAPRIRRGDLPERRRKRTTGAYDVDADARAIAGKIGRHA